MGDETVHSGRGLGQRRWYEFASNFCENKTVLDVGCGLGDGIDILKKKAKKVTGIDLDPRLKKENIEIIDLKEVNDDYVDVIVCIDVIEHVLEDYEFAKNLVRVAKNRVCVSTPNWSVTRCAWKYHIREYTPAQLLDIFSCYGKITLFKGHSNGSEIYEVKNLKHFLLFNHFRASKWTDFLARCFNFVLPKHMKIYSHLFLVLDMSKPEHLQS
ncbi:class I SAM-dependent methyltransferase [Methylomonas sp. MgM2]